MLLRFYVLLYDMLRKRTYNLIYKHSQFIHNNFQQTFPCKTFSNLHPINRLAFDLNSFISKH